MTRNKNFYFWIYFALLPTFLQGTEISFNIGAGYRQDSLNWNISGGEFGPNILSELKWKDLWMWTASSELKIIFPYNFYFRFNGDYGKICHGKNQDIDYLGDDRSHAFSISYSKANKGEAFDFSFGTGYQYSIFQDRFKISPLFGFSHHEQHLRMIHGELVFDLLDPSLQGSLSDLHSHYRAQWHGPWIGVDADFDLSSHFKIFGRYEYHWAFYNGTGHWNLRNDLDGFEHSGFGKGFLISMGTSYKFFSDWGLGAIIKYQTMQMHHGADRIFFTDANGPTSATTRLNQVNWHTFSAVATIGYNY